MSEEPPPEVEETPAQPPEVSDIEQGKALAVLSWASMFVGLPLFIIPLVQRDNAYALFHAKHAGTTYLAAVALAIALTLLTFVTCGLASPLMVLLFGTWVPTIDGLIKAINGQADPPLLVGAYTEKIFGSLQIENKD